MSIISIPFDNTYTTLPKNFYSFVLPQAPQSPSLIQFNHNLAEELQINNTQKNEPKLLQIFSGQSIPSNTKPWSTVYAGHQFGFFNPQLGDGRALTLGEVVDQNGERFDIQLKGSGQTPYSRMGDGKSWIGPVLREYLVSEFMHTVNVPTTRALAAVATNEPVIRETLLPGGILTRVAKSHLRIGSFEYFAAKHDHDNLNSLIDYTINRHMPHLNQSKDKKLQFFQHICNQQARLIAKWMGLGFIHGVLNTDNVSLAGITLDYGPCAFMDHFSFDKVFSSIDHNGRYSYENQPTITSWNLARLAQTLLLGRGPGDPEVTDYEEQLRQYEKQYQNEWLKIFTQKLGLESSEKDDEKLILEWLNLLQTNNLDFTLSFRNLSETLTKSNNPLPCSLNDFVQKWKERLQQNKISLAETKSKMDAINPLYIPRNHIIEQLIAEAVRGDYSLFYKMNQVLKNPFTLQDQCDILSQAPKPEEVVHQTFCGT